MTAILVDASGYIYRAFYAQPPLTKADGTPVGCIHGYLQMLWSLKKQHVTASHFGVCFDKGKSAARVAIYPEYKGHRPPMPDDLKTQLGMVRDATRAVGLPVIEAENVEADDLIASYAEAFRANGDAVIIVSVDKDLMQLMADGIEMFDPIKDRPLTVDDVVAKLGVGPEQATDAQALIGDSTDNVPGVPKIGPKTAGALLARFGSLNNLLANRQAVDKPAIRDSLMLNREKALLSRDLVTLMRDVPLPLPLKALEARDVDAAALVAFCKHMEFASLGADIEAFYGVAA